MFWSREFGNAEMWKCENFVKPCVSARTGIYCNAKCGVSARKCIRCNAKCDVSARNRKRAW